MAISSKDIETLWGRYQSEGVSKVVSVSQYFEANGIPYHVFEKWYKMRFRQPDVVDCVVDGVPDDAMAEKERYDTERMIMRAQYAMSLIEDSWRGGNLSDMEREDFKRQIADFVSALRDFKDEMAGAFIDLIKLLYKVELENIFFHRTEQEVVKARKQEAIPILSQLLQKATELLKMSDSKQVTISEKLHQALKYMINNWQELYGYVNIGNVLIDNNCCERAVRPFTNLRKNFGGFSSEAGARVAAIYLTFVETCKLMKKTALDFFKGFFGMTTSGRTDYELIVQELLC